MSDTKKEPDVLEKNILEDVRSEYDVARDNCKLYFERMYKILEFSMAVIIAIVGIDAVSPGSSYAYNTFEYIVFLHILPGCLYVLGLLYAYNAYSLTVYGNEAHTLKKRLYEKNDYGTAELNSIMINYIKTKPFKALISYGGCLVFYIVVPRLSIMFACWRFSINAQNLCKNFGPKGVACVTEWIHNPSVATGIWRIYLIVMVFLIFSIYINFRERSQRIKDTTIPQGCKYEANIKGVGNVNEKTEKDMNNTHMQIKNLWTQHKRLIIRCAVVGFCAPLIVVHLLFKWYCGIEFFVAEWDAGDLLGYIGTMLSFAGTIVLSVLALQASEKANALSKSVIEQEEDRYRLEMRPFVLVSNWKAYGIEAEQLVDDPQAKYIQIGEYKSGKAVGLALELTNTTQSCITVQYSGGTARYPDKSWGNAAVNQENLKMSLGPGAKDEFIFYANQSFMEEQRHQRIVVELILENRFSKRYKETFVLIITALSDKVSVTPGKWYCHLFAQEYTIGRLKKNEHGEYIYIAEEL